ncbi:MAG: hypothetical protein FWC50_06230 [Planctomycetaceae bacterium]|nr:hypothetical protein [Planctomycetaceae bacterium]
MRDAEGCRSYRLRQLGIRKEIAVSTAKKFELVSTFVSSQIFTKSFERGDLRRFAIANPPCPALFDLSALLQVERIRPNVSFDAANAGKIDKRRHPKKHGRNLLAWQ